MCQKLVEIVGFKVRNIITHLAEITGVQACSRAGFQKQFDQPPVLQIFGFFDHKN